MRIDESLARGLRRQEIKRATLAQDEISEILGEALAHGRQRMLPTFKRMVAAFRKSAGDTLFFDSLIIDKKRSFYTALVWEPQASSDAWIKLHRIKARCMEGHHVFSLARVSHHAIDRLFQRLQTMDLQEVMSELRPVAEKIVSFDCESGDDFPDELKVLTERGEARIVKKPCEEQAGKHYFCIVTWIKK